MLLTLHFYQASVIRVRVCSLTIWKAEKNAARQNGVEILAECEMHDERRKECTSQYMTD